MRSMTTERIETRFTMEIAFIRVGKDLLQQQEGMALPGRVAGCEHLLAWASNDHNRNSAN